eukprot:7490968-Alexandrium_andersonii.AAC.1
MFLASIVSQPIWRSPPLQPAFRRRAPEFMRAPKRGRSRGLNLGSCKRLRFAQRTPEASGGARL